MAYNLQSGRCRIYILAINGLTTNVVQVSTKKKRGFVSSFINEFSIVKFILYQVSVNIAVKIIMSK